MLKSCLHQASPRDTLRVLSGADYEEDLHTLFGSLITPSPSLLNHSYHGPTTPGLGPCGTTPCLVSWCRMPGMGPC